MDLKEKLKDLDEDQLDKLSEESEINDEEAPKVENDSNDEEFDPTAFDTDESEGSEIEEEVEDNGTDNEFDSIDSSYKWLSNLYSIESNYTNDESLATSLAYILQFTNTNWNTCLMMSGDINPVKGRKRYGSAENQMAAMFDGTYSEDADEFDIMATNKLIISMLQQYIDDHDVDKMGDDISDEQRNSNLDCIKVVLILMVSCNKYDYFPNLTLPKYAQKWIITVMQSISDTQDSVFNDWIAYLNKTKNKVIAEKCLEVGYQFFKVSKAIDTFGKYFTKDEIASIKKYPEVYAYFLECRDKFNKLSTGVNYKTLYPIFDITDDAFSKRKKKVLTEFVNKYSEMAEDNEKAVEALKTIFLEQSNN